MSTSSNFVHTAHVYNCWGRGQPKPEEKPNTTATAAMMMMTSASLMPHWPSAASVRSKDRGLLCGGSVTLMQAGVYAIEATYVGSRSYLDLRCTGACRVNMTMEKLLAMLSVPPSTTELVAPMRLIGGDDMKIVVTPPRPTTKQKQQQQQQFNDSSSVDIRGM